MWLTEEGSLTTLSVVAVNVRCNLFPFFAACSPRLPVALVSGRQEPNNNNKKLDPLICCSPEKTRSFCRNVRGYVCTRCSSHSLMEREVLQGVTDCLLQSVGCNCLLQSCRV